MSSVIGKNIKLSVFGESHGKAIGCVIDGLPAGFKIDFDALKVQMKRRAPGNDPSSTPRKEKDIPQLQSGILNGVTTGAPLAMIIENTNTRSSDYSNISNVPRPGHSDYTAWVKYRGFNDIRGGGHFSGRLTAPVVFAGSVARQILEKQGVKIGAHILQIGQAKDKKFDPLNVSTRQLDDLSKEFFGTIDPQSAEKMRKEIEACREKGDSVGGIVECAAVGFPAGKGANMFDTVESRLSYAMFGIPAVKGIEFGQGFNFAGMTGSEANDPYRMKDGNVMPESNNNGGILGGISNGAPIVFSVAIKPTPSIAKQQNSVDLGKMENTVLKISGRHDPCIVPRAVPVVEAMCAFTLLDILND